ncbi:N-acetylmuramic acid 6-phosphate etherase family protein [Proteus penneri ATCC 35198]|nr:N-acetylmuramic acid 6-phosphate etherase family protein [Proteus penneri ATCC 35198]
MKEDALSECLKNESNQETTQFSELSALELVTLINSADMTVANAVKKELPAIAKAVEKITERLQKGGRIFLCWRGNQWPISCTR